MSSLGPMEALLQQGLLAVQKAAGRKQKPLKLKCAETLKQVLADKKNNPTTNNADSYFGAFKMAIEDTSSTKPRAVAMAFIEKLIAAKYLLGRTPSQKPSLLSSDKDSKDSFPPTPAIPSQSDEMSNNKRARVLMDDIIASVSRVVMSSEDDNLHMQCLRTLLAAVATPECPVHDSSLRLVMKCCFRVFLIAKSNTHKATARSTLRFVLEAVQQQVEAAHTQLAAHPLFQHKVSTQDTEDEERTGDREDKESSEEERQKPGQEQEQEQEQGQGECTGEDQVSLPKEQEQEQKESEEPRTASPSSTTSNQQLKVYGQLLHAFSIVEFDVICLVTTLCRLSSRPAPALASQFAHSRHMQTKTLALELLVSVLHSGGSAVRALPNFVEAVKHELTHTLVHNSTTLDIPVFQLLSKLFVALVASFKTHLKRFVGDYLLNVFLRVLASRNSTYEHKDISLSVTFKLCSDPQLLVGLFLNYDCDLDADNVFQSTVHALEKTVFFRGKSNSKWMTAEQEAALRKGGLECVTVVMKSLASWTKVQQQQQQQRCRLGAE
mmetsp:Transcript_32075/g.62734  ORF Transcript_32075/g.62734 Transcript_32075/m.62734 type:complete len:550 (+) Transcript_32075:3-1652(+)